MDEAPSSGMEGYRMRNSKTDPDLILRQQVSS